MDAIPQADLKASYLAQKSEIDAAVARVLAGGWYILGEEVAAFEREFAGFLGTGHAVGVGNGTDALVLALKACGIGPGDTVATVSHTAVATAAAIEMVGAAPLLLDIDKATFTLDAAELARVLETPHAGAGRIRAVIPVHLYGQPADLAAITPLVRRHGAALIEDCAQCHGAAFDGRRVGTFGDVATFSFYPTKNLGAFGDGGLVATGDAAIAERLRMLRQYGWRERYVSDIAGINSRLDELQAAILRVKLRRLDEDNARRRAIAAAYDAGLAGTGLVLPERAPRATHVFHQYVVRTRDRERLRERLKAAGIGTNVHYPVPVHLQPAYRGRVPLGPSGLAETERAAQEVLSLPIYPQLADAAVARVIAALRASL
jgi:dTDP-4-amino-4,6-dideoxygalactose transaminase